MWCRRLNAGPCTTRRSHSPYHRQTTRRSTVCRFSIIFPLAAGRRCQMHFVWALRLSVHPRCVLKISMCVSLRLRSAAARRFSCTHQMNRGGSWSGSALLWWQHHKHCRGYYYYYYYYYAVVDFHQFCSVVRLRTEMSCLGFLGSEGKKSRSQHQRMGVQVSVVYLTYQAVEMTVSNVPVRTIRCRRRTLAVACCIMDDFTLRLDLS